MRVSEFYKLDRSQPYLKFIDVDIERDVKLFQNARAVRLLESELGDHCGHLLASFLEAVIGSIRKGDRGKALGILSHLKEPNETHLGWSKGKSDGRGLGPEKARQIWKALCNIKAVTTGLLSVLEGTGPVPAWCRSFDSISCSKGDELWD